MSTHSMLSPSASSRWLKCADSARVNHESPRKAGSYADEGTAAHALLEMCMRLGSTPEEFTGMDLCSNGFPVTEEMASAVVQAIDFIEQWQAAHPKGIVHLEQRVHWGALLGLTEEVSSGTADCILEPFDDSPVVVMDYKHGAGISVSPENNSQLMLYAFGVAQTVDSETYALVIVQPRARHIDGAVRAWNISKDALYKWARRVVAPQARRIQDGSRDREAGEHCRFCSAQATCRTLRDFSMQKAVTDFEAIPDSVPDMTPEEVAEVLEVLPVIEAWTKAVYAHALEELLKERTSVPGWKLVQGRAAPRQWVDEEQVMKQCKKNKLDVDAYAPRELLSPAKLEALVPHKGKAGKALFRQRYEALITRKAGPPHIAPDSDPRPVYSPGADFEALPDV